ncbi:hypothetical protein LCGC14_1748560 [marine sediment metagenome]|uniref:Uncharacterized protein n=1 Tax=marine sediment metagenome TaxID=412755 RepID=A0A0F9JJS0_9ZZZZ
MSITIKKTSLYYLVLVLVAIIIPIIHYPRIYGVDAFQVTWMANALREGALFSDNTWLIHPASYFGYYPFSHRAIGVPMFLAFLISLLNFFSFGTFGLTEAILVFNIILIIIIYKSSRNLGNRLFEEEWSRFVFVAAILLSPNIIYDTTMTVSTRIIITIVMIVLLNLNLKVLSNDNYNKFKTTIFLFLILLVGTLAHRLWMGTIITIIFMIFTVFIRKYKKLHHLTVFLILPLSIIAFFFGLEFYYADSSIGLGVSTTFFEIIPSLINYFGFWTGLISLFFPIGLIIILYKLTFTFKNYNAFKISIKKNTQLNDSRHEFVDNYYYLLLFIIPFLFMIFTNFYAITIFLPIIIIFSVQGLIYIKKFISRISKKLDWVFPIVLLFLLVSFYLPSYGIYSDIVFWNVFTILFISLILFLFVFLIINYNNLIYSRASFDPHKLKKGIWIIAFTTSFLAFSVINIEAGRDDVIRSPYPWENRYLTNEEIEIIEYFQNEDIDGLIFCAAGRYISERIGGVGFLPTFSGSTYIGIPLFYGLINPNHVHENTKFSLSELFNFDLFTFNETDPITELLNSIRTLDVGKGEDFHALVLYNVQYIISINDTFQSGGINNWPLIQSLRQSELFEPVFSTSHLLVWKIY